MKKIAAILATVSAVSGCSLSDFPTMKPIGSKNLADVEMLVSVIQCDLKAGADFAAKEGQKWVRDIRYAVEFDLTVVDSQGLTGNTTISTPFTGGLFLVSGRLGNSSKFARTTKFDLIIDTTKIPNCDENKDRKIKGSLGLSEWQKWLIGSYVKAKNNKHGAPFTPHEASFSVTFEIDNSGSLGPRFNNTGAGALDSGSGALSRGRKVTHKIVIVADELIERPKSKKARKSQDKDLLKVLQQRVLTESLRRID